MPSAFTCEIQVDTSIPDFMDASIPLNQIAEKVAEDSRKNIRNQTNIDGTTYVRLSKKTIQEKIRESSPKPNMALYRKGIMYRAISVFKIDKNEFEVGIKAVGIPRRDLIGIIHQEQGVPSKLGRITRTFLGFTDKTYKWANSRIDRWLKERIEKATKKQFNFKY